MKPSGEFVQQSDSVTEALRASTRGDPKAPDRLLALVYEDLRQIARSKMAGLGPGQTLQTTALVHEAWIKIAESKPMDWSDRAHFFGAAARAMRNILVDQARRKASLKHGGSWERVEILEPSIQSPEENILALDEILARLEAIDPRRAQVVMLRFFTGLATEVVAEILQVSVTTVERDWRFARAWLQNQLENPKYRRP